jgi:hypothetical protein
MATTTPTPDYLGVISPRALEQLQKSLKLGTYHPLLALSFSDPPHQVATNTGMAARHVIQTNETWLRSLKPRLLHTSDTANASSALGEIRAYGSLLETGMTVRPTPIVPGKKVRPEFEVNAGDGPVTVEVHTRQLDANQAKSLEAHHTKLQQTHKANVAKATAAGNRMAITTGAIGVTPFGAPDHSKPGDSVLTNTISRICGIKKDDRQIDPAKPFVLWLDLQDPTVWGYLSISSGQLVPMYTESKDGAAGSGGLWYALYGKKNDPMMQMQGLDYRSVPMLHDGRFALSAGISAVIYSLPKATVLFENPKPARPLPVRCRVSLLKAPFFRLDLSICEWSSGLVRSTVDLQKTMAAAAVSTLVGSNPP